MLTVSVIIPTYNRAPTIRRAVESALRQCTDRDEVIVIDDGSTDQTEEIIKALGGPIRYYRVSNGGAGYARNIGLELARNQTVAFLDSDDEWLPGKLGLQKRILESRPELSFCFSDLVIVTSDGREYGSGLKYYYGIDNVGEKLLGKGVPLSSIIRLDGEWKNITVYIGDLYHVQMEFICVSPITTLFRRNVLGGDIRFSEDLTYHEDWEFFSRLAKMGPALYLDSATAKLFFHDLPQLTKTTMINIYNNRLKVLNRVWGQDRNYLASYEKRFDERKREQHLGLLNELFNKRMFGQIRSELRSVRNPPLKFIMVKYLPDDLLHGLIWLYRKIKFAWKFAHSDSICSRSTGITSGTWRSPKRNWQGGKSGQASRN